MWLLFLVLAAVGPTSHECLPEVDQRGGGPAGSVNVLQPAALCTLGLWQTAAPLSSFSGSSSIVAALQLPDCLHPRLCGHAWPEPRLSAVLPMVCPVSVQASMQSAGGGDIRTCTSAV